MLERFYWAKIDYFKPSLIVVDGVNAAMNVMGLDLEKNKDATSFSQEVLRPMRLHNAAILTIDHVTKSKDNRGNYAIGAQAKRADIDGCAVAVEVEIAFGRGIDGALALKVTKDRPGFVRAICQEGKDLGVANIKAIATGNIKITLEGATAEVMSIEKKWSRYLHLWQNTALRWVRMRLELGCAKMGFLLATII